MDMKITLVDNAAVCARFFSVDHQKEESFMCLLQSNMTYILTYYQRSSTVNYQSNADVSSLQVSPRYLPYNKKSSSTDAIIERFVMPAMVPDARYLK